VGFLFGEHMTEKTRKYYGQLMIPKHLHQRVKVNATLQGVSMIEFLIQLLDEYEAKNRKFISKSIDSEK
jgi:predicted HicB family RNase H-like nuclease